MVPLVLDITVRPDVFEARACGCSAYRRMEVLACVNRRIKVDEINGLRVDATQNRQVLLAEKRAVLYGVLHGYARAGCC